jgi:glutathione S-transferase
VKTEGFDACVVPLLVDHDKRRAIVDSAKIISYIEREVPPVPLIPENPELAAAVDKQVAINDTIPHPGILYGFHKNDPRPDFQIHIMQNIYDAKREALEFLIEQNKDDDELVRVYRAKITKEMAGKKLQKDPAYMAKILNEFRGLIANLDKDLEIHESPWICGQDYTMADCIWGISLYRIQWLGHAGLWDKYPGVQDYAHRLYKRPSFQKAYIKWDNSRPQSPHTVEIDAA